eukprot:TRINITY_DN362_c0_g1_i2.p4 TRINITY_DN362_c0_g1~~TRINITY_DN362_c0_g1_i2.p4  ORF type:complete len:117 (-),score=22.46 TRINITY_DN362_c0_g1_i2:2255-2605(-)
MDSSADTERRAPPAMLAAIFQISNELDPSGIPPLFADLLLHLQTVASTGAGGSASEEGDGNARPLKRSKKSKGKQKQQTRRPGKRRMGIYIGVVKDPSSTEFWGSRISARLPGNRT